MDQSIFMRKTVSSEFRLFVKRTLPNLNKNEKYWRFVQYLLFPQQTTDEGFPIIHYDILQSITNISKNNRHFKAIDFLKDIQTNLLPEIEWKEHNHIEGKARVITKTGIPECVFQALTIERITFFNKPAEVYFVSGKIITKKEKAEVRMIDKVNALNEFYMAGCQDARDILDYLNNLPPNRFSSFTKHIQDAVEEAQTIEHIPTRNRQLDILRYINQQPQAFYKPTSKTVRITASNDSVLRLKKNVRQVLVRDLVSIDLNYAQLSIAAKVWDVPRLQELLKAGEHIWHYIAEHMGSSGLEMKQVLKKAIYSIMFGMSERNLINGTNEFDGLRLMLAPFNASPEQFLSIDIVRDLLKARRNVYGQIVEDTGAKDQYGRHIALTDQRNVGSVAAQVIQSYELALISPIYRAARLTDQWYVVLHLHDGCFIKVRDKRSFQYWVDKINEIVIENAAQMGIIATLSFEYQGV